MKLVYLVGGSGWATMLSSIVSVAIAGLIAGAAHVVMGPDHLAAVAPLALAENKNTWKLGLKWGLGHAGGVVVVALIAWLLRGLISVEVLSSHFEGLVGVMLIGIGIWGLVRVNKVEIHQHEHVHDGNNHLHFHMHSTEEDTFNLPQSGHVHTHAAFAVGILHGLAGASHFLGVLPALAMPTKIEAAMYLFNFALGTIFAMSVFSYLLSFVGNRSSRFGIIHFKIVMSVFSGFAILLGVYWLI